MPREKQSVYVIGHRNPDTDAICSAIGYAAFLRASGMEPTAVAARCGPLNVRTEFVLSRAGLEAPFLLMDARPTAGQICRHQVIFARESFSVKEAYRLMLERKLKSLPVVPAEGHNVIGMLPLLSLLELLFPHGEDKNEHRVIHSSLDLIAKALDGQVLHGRDMHHEDHFLQMVGAMSAEGFVKRMREHPGERLVVVSGDRPTIQLPAIEYGVRCLVVTGGYRLSDAVLRMAKEEGVTVIYSPYDTANSTLMIRSAQTVRGAVQRDFLSVPSHARVQEFRSQVAESDQHLFPVIDDTGALDGVFSKSDLIEARGPRLILVDHNELVQAVQGADEADIVQVIDHHRLGGGLTSREPIRFINEPVGSTSTIVTEMFMESDVLLEVPVATCLAAGVIADTLQLRSPTTSDRDRRALEWLAPRAGMDIAAFAEAFFSAGSALQAKKPSEVLAEDRKIYIENGRRFAVSQVEELGMDPFWRRKDELIAALKDSLDALRADAGFLLITDITRQMSLLLCCGPEKVLNAIEYPELEKGLFSLQDVVSRKKQLLPYLIDLFGRM